MEPPLPAKVNILVVGAGFGGLGMGSALRRSGEEDFIILEKGSTVGGVWRDNTYPGCTCDVPSHLYSFSFAPYRSRAKRFPPQQEILGYLQQVAADEGLLTHLHLNKEIAQARFRDDVNDWEVVTTSQHTIYAQVVIFAVGQLHKPNYPNISGLAEFCGPVLHPAEWDSSVDFRGKHISVIGTGSSAAQMLPSLASIASSVTVYQRNPHWVLPKLKPDFGPIGRALLQSPGAHQLYRKALHHGADILLSPIPRSKMWRNTVEMYARRSLRKQVAESQLIEKLAPKYPLGTKRILFDSQFYPALNRPNVQLVDEPICFVSKNAIETKTGIRSTDVVICATGYRASEFLVPLLVQGRSGRSLNEDWKDGAEAFMGLAIHGYPNLFMIAGPNSFNPAGSNPDMKEAQISYILECLRWKRNSNALSIEVSWQATARYQEWLVTSMEKTVWQGCTVNNWYRHEGGKITNPWPKSLRVFKRILRRHPSHSFDRRLPGDRV